MEFLQAVKFYLEEQRFEQVQDASEKMSYSNYFHQAPFMILLRNLTLIRACKSQSPTKASSVYLEADGVYQKLAKLIRRDRKSLELESIKQKSSQASE